MIQVKSHVHHSSCVTLPSSSHSFLTSLLFLDVGVTSELWGSAGLSRLQFSLWEILIIQNLFSKQRTVQISLFFSGIRCSLCWGDPSCRHMLWWAPMKAARACAMEGLLGSLGVSSSPCALPWPHSLLLGMHTTVEPADRCQAGGIPVDSCSIQP